MTRTISFRIADELAERVARHSERWRSASDSELYRRVVEEWARLQQHPGVRFVDGPSGRRAALVDGPDVWEVIAIAKSFEFHAGRIADAYPSLSARQLDAAVAYYEDYREEIEAALARNARAADDLERELELLGR